MSSLWKQLGGDIDGEAAGDRSGYSVALSANGKTVAIGALDNDGPNTGNTSDNRGSVRVYDFSNNSSIWVKRGQDIDGEFAGDAFGWSVALSANGNTVAIAGRYNDESGLDAGSVRVYDFSNNLWVKRGQDIDGEAAGDHSGYSLFLSADGNTLAIGAIFNVIEIVIC
jgi:transposase